MGRITQEPPDVETALSIGDRATAAPARAAGASANSPNASAQTTTDNVSARERGRHPEGVHDLTN